MNVRPERRRIVFSATAGAGEWRAPTQLWLDPNGLVPRDLAAKQSRRLHRAIPQSTFHPVPRSGHMVHQTDTDTVMSAIDEVFALADAQRLSA